MTDLVWPPDDVHWLYDQAALASGLAATPDDPEVQRSAVRATWSEIPDLVRTGGPCVLRVHGPEGGMIALRGPADVFGRVRALDRGGRWRRVPADDLIARMRAPLEHHEGPAVDRILDTAGLRGRRRTRTRRRLLQARLHDRPLDAAVLLRAAPSAPALAQIRDARIGRPLAAALGTRLLGTVLGVTGWIAIGNGALSGHVDAGWVVGWALLMTTSLVVTEASRYLQGQVALRGGAWTKHHLLQGALRTDPLELRGLGTGGLLGRMAESQALEDLVLTGGLSALLTVVDLLAAAWMLSWAPGGPLLVTLLAASTLVVLALGHRLYGLQLDWTARRRTLTGLLVERMVGHRTRLAQADPSHWYDGEDEALEAYHRASERLDTHQILFVQVGSSLFTLAALGVLGSLFVSGATTSTGMAIGLGAILWAQGALAPVVGQARGLVAALVAWHEIGPLVRAAGTAPLRGAGDRGSLPPPGAPLIRAMGLGYERGGRAILKDLDATLNRGDRVVLTGASGSGKSTLTRLLTGISLPSSGVLLCRGLDHTVLGEGGWRRSTVAAPQFHDNHVFEQSVSFNLLLGRSWPASFEEEQEAHRICEELGLGDLIERMPGGLGQALGESGWRLSHGERSRLFLARALLHGADLVVLDESFGALDPLTLQRCLTVTEARAETLVVVAHP